MALYEVVREIQNSCVRNQMRDVFFDEVETEDPEAYVKSVVRGENVNLTVETGKEGNITIFAECSGLQQKFLFTKI